MPSKLPTQLRWHVAALGVLLVAVWPLLHLDAAFISDEGSYVTQARAVGEGTWDVGYAFEEADPAGRFVPLYGTVRSENGTFAYVSHPLWPVAMSGSGAVLGEEIGFRALAVGALLAVCAISWAIARSLAGARAGPWGFWFGAASPALANAWITWSHTPAAAAGGLTVLGVLRARTDPRWLVAAGLGSGVGVLLRSESVLWSAAVAAGVMLVDRSHRALRDASVVVAAAALAFLGEGAWSTAIVGSSTGGGESLSGDLSGRGAGASAIDRLRGLRLATVDGAFASTSGKLLAIGCAALVLGAVVAIRRGHGGSRLAARMFAAAAVLLAVRILVAPDDPIPGMVLAAPVLLLALLWPVMREQRWLPASMGLFVLAVGATTYPDGGSLQWGGRYLSPLVCPLAGIAAAGLVALLRDPGPRPRDHHVAFGVAALLVVQAIGAVVVPDQVRRDTAAPVARVVGAGPDVLIAKGGQIPRLDLDGWAGRCWIATPDDAGADDLEAVLDVLRASGVQRATYVGFERAEVVSAGGTVERELPGLLAGIVDIPDPAAVALIATPYACTGR